ncbi:MAG: 2-oxoglutarate dehydrogenase complex dihydrolipoyllysine-residue succinyltransferase [Verrucomicrobia bacterium]|nr:2-oxoglutarate dehydrogenase complex dihydrolipoyllysine-residue succinyltransferase [Verrucomicrobiota bacterium]
MTLDLKVPAVGESITEVEIGEWLKAVGDPVARNETLAVIETEKATVELPAPEPGKLTQILKQKGQTATPGETIARMETGVAPSAAKAEAKPAPPSPATPPAAPAAQPGAMPVAQVFQSAVSPASSRQRVPDSQRQRIGNPRHNRLEVCATEPSPPAPRLADRLPTPPAREERVVPMTRLRRTVARRLVEAQHTAALLTTFNEVDMTSVLALRQEFQEAFQKKFGIKLGLMSFFVKAVTDALKLVPQLNAEVRDDQIVYRNYHDIGVAVGTERGLVVPVLMNVDRLSFAEIERGIADFARRARDNQLRPEDLEGGTFTLTNGGVFGSLLSTPIINPPQSGVLGMHAIQDRPVALGGQVVIRPMMYVALTYDHRLVDGREAVTFLKRVKDAVETPARMLLEV